MTTEEHKKHLMEGTDKCLVCDTHPLQGVWTDYNGQIRCYTCGTTYQILGSHLSDETLNELGITNEQVAKTYCDCFCTVPVLREFWAATHSQIPMGKYYVEAPPWSHEVFERFMNWLAANADRLAPLFPDAFYWDRIRARSQQPA